MRQELALLSSFPEEISKVGCGAKAGWLLESIQYSNVKLYQQRKWMENSEKYLNGLVQSYTSSVNGYGTGL